MQITSFEARAGFILGQLNGQLVVLRHLPGGLRAVKTPSSYGSVYYLYDSNDSLACEVPFGFGQLMQVWP